MKLANLFSCPTLSKVEMRPLHTRDRHNEWVKHFFFLVHDNVKNNINNLFTIGNYATAKSVHFYI
jgi:hypothetical protein